MRLIYAEILKSQLYESILVNKDMDCLDFLRVASLIDAQQTAYSVEQVVEELEELREKDVCDNLDCDVYRYNKICGLETDQTENVRWDKAIEIVKHGCVADDVCEWKQTSTAKYKTSCGYKLEEYFDTNACYCKQCGKKIRVV